MSGYEHGLHSRPRFLAQLAVLLLRAPRDLSAASLVNGALDQVFVAPLYVDETQFAEIVLGEKVRLRPMFVRQLEGEGLPPTRQLFGSMR